ncbi:terminase TerL endonuclease subunit, partial [Loigolactobacillus rennini]
GPATLSGPIMDFKLSTINGDIKHAKNPLLDIAIKNAVAKDTNDSIMIEKKKNREKIDPLMATIFAFVIASDYEWNVETNMPLFI